MAKKPTKSTKPSAGSVLPSEPDHYPASNLMLADVIMRMGTGIVRKGVERTFLRGRYGKATAKNLTKNRSMGQTLTTTAIAKIGTKSIPGAALVTGGLVVKLLFDRSKARQDARKRARLTDKE